MLKSSDFSEEEMLKKREEAERKARRGEIDPVQEYTFSLISKITGLPRPAILNFMFEQPLILDELDLLYKTDTKKRVIFYYQVIMLSRHGFSVLTMTVRRPSIVYILARHGLFCCPWRLFLSLFFSHIFSRPSVFDFVMG